jgi:uncharacterized protein YqjF (DUF2071 family)
MANPPDNVQWVWRQIWRDVLFLHWRVDAEDLRPHVPGELSIDTCAADAWVSLVLFRLEVAPIGLPSVPGFSSLVEVNLRTYVERNDQPGIYFLSIHADNLAALSLARWFTPLPYAWASIRYQPGEQGCHCDLRRSAAPACELSLQAEIDGPRPQSSVDDRQTWLLERYRAYAPARAIASELQTAVVDHDPWIVQSVHIELHRNSLGSRFQLDLERPPDVAHFCREVSAGFSRFESCGTLQKGNSFFSSSREGWRPYSQISKASAYLTALPFSSPYHSVRAARKRSASLD